jgi:hypothetical protein
MSNATVGLKVIFPPQETRRTIANVNVLTQEREDDEPWTGDRCLVLDPHNKRLQDALSELRSKPKLVLMNSPMVRNLQDTVMLWNTWKSSVLDNMCTMASLRVQLIYQQQLGEGDTETVANRLRECEQQLQTTLGTWREHRKYMNDEKTMMHDAFARINDNVAESKEALNKKMTPLRESGTLRVLLNAISVVESTMEERKEMVHQKCIFDLDQHDKILKATQDTLDFFVSSLQADLDGLKLQAYQARVLVDESMAQKKIQWAVFCQRLQAHFESKLQQPLRELLLNEHFSGTTDLSMQVLNNSNDPHCLRRCETAMRELLILRTGPLAPAAAPTSHAYDDDDLAKTRDLRRKEEQQARLAYEQRLAALASERKGKTEALQRAMQHMEALKGQAQALKQHSTAQWQDIKAVDADSNKRAAAMTRIALRQQELLAGEMQASQKSIDELSKALQSLKMGKADQAMKANDLLNMANLVYDVCRRMHCQFESAVHVEEMMYKVIQHQYMDGARAMLTTTETLLRQTVDVARAKAGMVRVDLDRRQDDIADANRRISTLNQARYDQETLVQGPEIGLYSALEEHVGLTVQRNNYAEMRVQAHVLLQMSDVAVAFLQRLIVKG